MGRGRRSRATFPFLGTLLFLVVAGGCGEGGGGVPHVRTKTTLLIIAPILSMGACGDDGPTSSDAEVDTGGAASCDNGVQDGDESDVDCGGSCPRVRRGLRLSGR